MVNAKMFRKIQELKKRGYGKLAIGRKLNIDPATVRKYYNMKADEYHRYKLETLSRGGGEGKGPFPQSRKSYFILNAITFISLPFNMIFTLYNPVGQSLSLSILKFTYLSSGEVLLTNTVFCPIG